MSSFDFSLYDSDIEPEKKVEKPSKKIEQPKFDFSLYENEEQVSNETKETPRKSLKDMSISEKVQYGKELEREQRQGFSKAFSKGALSGVSLGATENIPGFSTEETEGEPPLAGGFGNLVGSSAPVNKAFKVAGAALKYVPKAPKIVQNFMKAFGAGSLYESGKQVVKGISGNETDISQIPKTGVEFVALDSILRGVGKLGKKFFEMSPKQQGVLLEKKIIPEDLPKSQYDTAEEILEVIKKGTRPAPPPPPGGGPPPPPPGGPPINPLRITPGRDIGLRPATKPEAPSENLQENVGRIFSNEPVYNSTQAGKAIKNEIMDIDTDVYEGVNDLYNTSRELNRGIEQTHPELIQKIDAILEPLEAIPEPSTIQSRLIKAGKRIRNRLESPVEGGGEGETELAPINNQTLIDQIQSLRQIIDFDFRHGDSKNIFRPLINALQDSVIEAAESSGSYEASQAFNEARASYRAWTEGFDNDYINPFRDTSNENFSKLFKGTLNFDESNVVRRILGLSENGQRLSRATTREIVENNLSKYFDKPESINSKDFDKSIRELEAVITPEEAQQVRDQFNEIARKQRKTERESQRKPNFKAKKAEQKPFTPEELIASKYTGKEPEYVQDMMNSRSKIKELKEDLSHSSQKKELFETLKKQKMRSILREGNIEKEFTGDDLYKLLNKEKNYELFSEFLGENEAEVLRQTAKEIGKDQVKKELRGHGIKKLAHKAAALKTFELIFNLL